ncbi:amidohydrolase family protein [Thermogutta sp.]|uniref:amidohydrolase family protein n=1 Tax=Thermogutta sp. TaxID=1962930 RepID=UPI00322077EB
MNANEEHRGLDRRSFLVSAGIVSTSLKDVAFANTWEERKALSQGFGTDSLGPIVDTNVYLFGWPFRKLPDDTPEKLVTTLRRYGVVEAWAGSLEGVFHSDMRGVNERLVEECSRWPDLLRPCGTIHPGLPDWEEDFRQCVDDWGIKILRLFPNYHGYSLDGPEVEGLLHMAAQRRVILQIVVEMEDSRTQPHLFRVPPVNLSRLERLLEKIPEVTIMLLNAHRICSPTQLRRWMESGRVFVDLSMLEGVGGIERVVETVPVERVCFGSFLPLFYFAAAHLKLVESRLSPAVRQAVASENARRLLEQPGSG